MKLIIIILVCVLMWWLSGLITNRLLPKLAKCVAKLFNRHKEDSGNGQ